MKLKFTLLSILFSALTYGPCPAVADESSTTNYIKPAVPNKDCCGFYTKLEIGASIPNNRLNFLDYDKKKPKTSLVVGLAFGKAIKPVSKDFSVELAGYHFNKFKVSGSFVDEGDTTTFNQQFQSNAIFVNANYDLVNYYGFIPFITGGLGVSHNEAKDYHSKKDGVDPNNNLVLGKTKNSFAFNLGLGLKTKVSNSSEIGLSYKYIDLGKFQTTKYHLNTLNNTMEDLGPIKARLRTHNILLSFIYKF